MKIFFDFLNKIIEIAQSKNGATKIGLFEHKKEPIPQVVAKIRVKSGVEQNANKNKARQENNLRNEKLKKYMFVKPSQKIAMIDKKEIISRDVSLFVNPLIENASLTTMHAYINKSPKNKFAHDKIG